MGEQETAVREQKVELSVGTDLGRQIANRGEEFRRPGSPAGKRRRRASRM
jgi:hypothetical protein